MRAAPDGRPNIVLIVLDTLTAGAAGLGTTPARMPGVEAIAEGGLFFEHAVSNAPWTYPAHASLFTGLLPSEHGMGRSLMWGTDAEEERSTLRRVTSIGPKSDESIAARWLPAVLARAGYETIGASNNWWVGRGTQMDFGFTSFRDTLSPGRFPLHLELARRSKRLRRHGQAAYFAYRAHRGSGDMLGADLLRRVRESLGQRTNSRPYFLFVNLMEAHAPYITPRSASAIRERRAKIWVTFRAMQLMEPRRMIPYSLGLLNRSAMDPAVRLQHALHRKSAEYLDGLVQELMKASDTITRSTLFCVTSDHGESFGEDGVLGHGLDLGEAALHVPLVLAGWEIPRDVRGATVELRRIYRTLLDAAGIDAPEGSPRSLLDPGPQVALAEREAFQLPRWADGSAALKAGMSGRLRAVYRDPWKLSVSARGERLVDLSSDRGETHDLAAAHPDLVASMRATLPRWPVAQVEDRPVGETDTGHTTPSQTLTAEEEELMARHLTALGYLD